MGWTTHQTHRPCWHASSNPLVRPKWWRPWPYAPAGDTSFPCLPDLPLPRTSDPARLTGRSPGTSCVLVLWSRPRGTPGPQRDLLTLTCITDSTHLTSASPGPRPYTQDTVHGQTLGLCMASCSPRGRPSSYEGSKIRPLLPSYEGSERRPPPSSYEGSQEKTPAQGARADVRVCSSTLRSLCFLIRMRRDFLDTTVCQQNLKRLFTVDPRKTVPPSMLTCP